MAKKRPLQRLATELTKAYDWGWAFIFVPDTPEAGESNKKFGVAYIKTTTQVIPTGLPGNPNFEVKQHLRCLRFMNSPLLQEPEEQKENGDAS